MNRRISIIIIISYLFLAATFVNSHNHPINEGEKDSCPVYIISHSFYSDTAFNNTFLNEYAPEQIEYLQISKDIFPNYITHLYLNNRAPPLQTRSEFQF